MYTSYRLEMSRSSVNAEVWPNNSAECSARFGSATCDYSAEVRPNFGKNSASLAALLSRYFPYLRQGNYIQPGVLCGSVSLSVSNFTLKILIGTVKMLPESVDRDISVKLWKSSSLRVQTGFILAAVYALCCCCRCCCCCYCCFTAVVILVSDLTIIVAGMNVTAMM